MHQATSWCNQTIWSLFIVNIEIISSNEAEWWYECTFLCDGETKCDVVKSSYAYKNIDHEYIFISVTKIKTFVHLGPSLQTWINLDIQHGYLITCQVKCVMELLVHPQTTTAAPLQFREWISNFVLHF